MVGILLATAAVANAGNSTLSTNSMAFIQNRGQWDAQAQFLLQAPGANLWVTKTGTVIDFYRETVTRFEDENGVPRVKRTRDGDVVKVDFVGASAAVQPVGVGRSNEFVSFITDGQEIGNVGKFAEAKLVNVLPGVSARYYVDGGAPRYDVILAPGANPKSVQLQYTNAKNLRIGADGTLQYDTTLGTVREQNLFVYQTVGGVKRQVPAQFEIKGGKVGFKLGAYDQNQSLVIDPQILHAGTYIGGGANDLADDVKVHPSGDIITAGTTTSTNFPTVNSYQGDQTGTDWFLTRHRPGLGSRVFSTYVGGNNNDRGTGASERTKIAIAGNGDIWLGGTTSSTNLPTTAGVIQPTDDSGDSLWIARFGATPSAVLALKAATYLGGSSGENFWDLDVHQPSGNIAVSFGTASTNLSAAVAGAGARSAITTGSAAQTTKGTGTGFDAYVAVLNAPLTRVLMGTYFGGNDTDQGRAVAFGRGFDAVFLAGTAESTDYTFTFGNVQNTGGSDRDNFLAQIRIKDASVVNSAAFGYSTEDDTVEAIAVDQVTNVAYLTGRFQGPIDTTAWGTTISVQYGFDSTFNGAIGDQDAFVAAFSDKLNRVRFTYLGAASTDANDSGKDIIVTPNGGSMIVGYTRSPGFPVVDAGGTNIAYTAPADSTAGQQGFIARFSSALALQGSSVFGSPTASDSADAIALNTPFNNVLVAGNTQGADLPVTAGVAQGTSGGGTEAFLYDLRFYTDPVSLATSGTTVSPTSGIVARVHLNSFVQAAAGQSVTFTLSNASARFSNGTQSITVTIPQNASSIAVNVIGTGAGAPTTVTLSALSSGTTVSTTLSSQP
ncbi:MAG: hypothetical protein SFX74_00165 [Fimbriimonadaceae bacterium]|nr:hypothetical protein [Fimbriimonadaceae bacterium]